jgi:glycosyltransferase involved in cell wall biosynthesis
LLTVVGYVGPEIDLDGFVNHPHIKIQGPVADLRPYYNQSRLFIAPTRFAAGTPYKLYETASFGLPSVATGLLAGQLEWQGGVELLTAPVQDATKFAAQIAHLYRSEQDWNELRANALARISRENSSAQFAANVRVVLNACGLTIQA